MESASSARETHENPELKPAHNHSNVVKEVKNVRKRKDTAKANA